jgi:uncharacterized lipoprotein YbaY
MAQNRPALANWLALLLAGTVLGGCASSSSSQALPGMVTVTGTADLPSEAELPARAILQVRMVNTTLAGKDESQLRPGLEILAESIAYPGPKRPFPFTLEVPAVLFQDGDSYEIRAELYVGPQRAIAATKTVKVNPSRDISGLKLDMLPAK